MQEETKCSVCGNSTIQSWRHRLAGGGAFGGGRQADCMLALQTAHAARSDKHMCTCRLHYLLQSCALVRRWRTCKSESAEARAKPHCAIKHTSQNHPIKNCSRQHMVCTYCSAFGVPRIAGRCNADADAFSQVLSSARTWHSVQWSVEMPGRRRRRRQRLGRLAASLSPACPHPLWCTPAACSGPNPERPAPWQPPALPAAGQKHSRRGRVR